MPRYSARKTFPNVPDPIGSSEIFFTKDGSISLLPAVCSVFSGLRDGAFSTFSRGNPLDSKTVRILLVADSSGLFSAIATNFCPLLDVVIELFGILSRFASSLIAIFFFFEGGSGQGSETECEVALT